MEELLGREADSLPQSRFRYRIANSEAAAHGVRSVGQDQMQQFYGYSRHSHPNGNLDAYAAILNTEWFGDRWQDPSVLLVDDHSNNMPGLTFAGISYIPRRTTIAAAHMLGFCNLVVYEKDAFFDYCSPDALVVDYSVREGHPEDDQLASQSLFAGIHRLLYESPASLEDYYKEIIALGKISFFCNVDIPTFDADGGIAEYMDALLAIDVSQAFTEIPLTNALRTRFGIPLDVPVVAGTYAFQNMSREIPHLGIRTFFGNLLYSVPLKHRAGSSVEIKMHHK